MTIGLIRHFKVNAPVYKYPLTSEEFNETQRVYDAADVFEREVDLGTIIWQACYASTLKRAQETARSIFKDEMTPTDLVVEVDAAAVYNSKKKRSFTFWVVTARFAWLIGLKSQKESRKQTLARCEQFYNELRNSGRENILVVTHGFFMREFAAFLKKKGFKGKLDFTPKNAKLYLFTKD